MAKIESPQAVGDRGNQGSGPQPKGSSGLVSAVKDSNKSEAKGHDNGNKKG